MAVRLDVVRTNIARVGGTVAVSTEVIRLACIGLIVAGWGADWPDGFDFPSQIVDSEVIRDAGSTNLRSERSGSAMSRTGRSALGRLAVACHGRTLRAGEAAGMYAETRTERYSALSGGSRL